MPFRLSGLHPSACLLLSVSMLLSACAIGTRSGSGIYSSSELPEPAFDRTGYGNSLPGFWSALTAPEVRALQDRDKAAAGDPAALLALAIFASGDKRAPEEYAAMQARVAAFTQALIHLDLEEARSPAPIGFATVKRGVGIAQQRCLIVTVGGKDRHADAQAGTNLVPVDLELIDKSRM